MANQMSQFKATANAHMRSAMEGGAKWDCECEACHEIRSLIGMEKTLDVRPLVRAIREIEDRLHNTPDDPERRRLLERYFKLYDQLADVMAK
jgi:hypothetical protein